MSFLKVEIFYVLPSSFVPGHSSFLPLSVTIFLLSGVASNSWVCARRKQSMCKGEVCHLFQLVPLRGFGGLPNKWLVTFPLIEGARRRFLLIFRHTRPYCLWPKAYHLFLFLSPRNPVFTIFCIVVLYYESIIYTPFLYQSSKIRISFL